MGYTHYIYLPKEVKRWNAIREDLKRAIKVWETETGKRIRGGNGKGEPVLAYDIIAFNGDAGRGEDYETCYITKYPEGGEVLEYKLVSHKHLLEVDDRIFWEYRYGLRQVPCRKQKLRFVFCKTAGRPYDTVVQALYLIVKKSNPEAVIHSDGDLRDWEKAIDLLASIGYNSKALKLQLEKDFDLYVVEDPAYEISWEYLARDRQKNSPVKGG